MITLNSLFAMTNIKPIVLVFVTLSFLLSFNAIAQEDPEYSVYLIGDTGKPNTEEPDEVFINLKKRLDQEDKHSTIVFLGDNIYHNGLPPEGLVAEAANRKSAEKKLLVQLKAIDNFKGKIYFIPGNHDWNDAQPDGIHYIKAQEEYIEFFLDRGDVLIPDHGCPGPEVKKLGKDVVLVAMDSQWWLHPHSDEQSEKSDCKNKNIDDIMQELSEILDEYDDKRIIIALHHPIYSDGSHNGHFTLKDHLFPLTAANSKLWIPLPVIGSLYPFVRTTFGAKQDMAHPLYQRLIEEIENVMHGKQNILLASGHEHNQQYFFNSNNHYIKSGSGSKSSPLPKRTKAIFSDESKGYAKVEYYKSGEVKLKFYSIENSKEIEKYNETIALPSASFGPKDVVQNISTDPVMKSASGLYTKGGFHKFIFGNLYREDWATPVSFRGINLSTEKGGLKPRKIGGGMSSKSIRLRTGDKKEYVLRSVEKGVAKVVPQIFRKSVVQSIFQDGIAASQPYAALVVPPLADAVGVYHTNPELVYLPEQPILGDYNAEYGGQLYLFEERPAGNMEELEDFGNSRKIISYSDMIEKVQSSSSHHIHPEQVLRSRLLDIYLGDWDRHDDQWRWATFKEKHHDGGNETHTFYEPIPRDRDQVMYRYKGLLPSVAKLLSPELRKFQTFGPDIKNLKYLAYNARHFDRSYLSELERDDWEVISEQMVNNISDDVIQSSLSNLPKAIQELRSEEYQLAFSERRNKLKKWAMEHYGFLAQYVDVVGTKKDEMFQAVRNADGTLDVKVFQIKKSGELDDLMYERTFHPNETKEVRLYGLSGKDQFDITGTSNKGPIIRVIGGKGNDELLDESVLKGGKKSTYVYDKSSDSGMDPGTDGKDKRSSDYRVNNYDRKEFYYNASIGIPFVSFNPDDGVVLSYTHSLSTYGFRKSPYNSKHNIGLRYATNTAQFSLDYSGKFVDAVGKAELGIDATLHLPDNVSNFFGLSNVRSFDVNDFGDIDFFQYERTDLKFIPSLNWTSERGASNFSIGPYYRYVNVGSNESKFVTEQGSGLNDIDFESASYLGLEATYSMSRIDNIAFPTTGMKFQITPSYNHNMSNSNDRFTALSGSLTLYNYLWIPKPFVLASKIEGGVNFGDFNFYQGHYIGLNNGLRAFRKNRFGGKSSLLLSNDLRVKIGTTKGGLPFTFGLLGTYDIGRVWNDGEDSNIWHKSYGGGFFISPFDVMPISFYFSKSTEDTSAFLIRLGFAI